MTDRISLLIKAKNLSAAQFADEIGVQRSSISHLMSGRNKPSLDLIQKTLQRFPEVSTEWLLFGRGEMVRELNLFDSQARSKGIESNGKLVFNTETNLPNNERVPTLFSPGTQDDDTNIEIPYGKDATGALNPSEDIKAKPSPIFAENAKSIGARKGSSEDSDQVISKKSSKIECAINQIIVFYDDRTFIAYSPGN